MTIAEFAAADKWTHFLVRRLQILLLKPNRSTFISRNNRQGWVGNRKPTIIFFRPSHRHSEQKEQTNKENMSFIAVYDVGPITNSHKS